MDSRDLIKDMEFEYRFSEDENMLYVKERGGSIEYKWQRIVNSQQK